MPRSTRNTEHPAISVAITGSGGSGAVTAGQILLEAVARAGFHGLMTRSAGPQIRGGESAAMVRFAARPVDCMDDRFDILVGLDWLNVTRFVDEIPLDGDSLVLADTSAAPVPDLILASGARVVDVPFKSHADAVEGGRVNIAALGAVGAVMGLPIETFEVGVRDALRRKGDAVVRAALACIRRVYGSGLGTLLSAPPVPQNPGPRWSLSGNEAGGLGALRGGVRFVAAYPITPASEMLEWMAPRLERLGGSLLQAEDELASINMIIGASFGGVPSLTATSGPGLSLMMEGIGLAVASETPVVVANVMRGGPSTGIPTKSEQADLDIALFGLHGDAPHLVLAPLSIADCVRTTHWAVNLAEHLQTAAIVLSDQSLGQSRAVIDPPPAPAAGCVRVCNEAPGAGYRRYALTPDGVSPIAHPGTPGGMHTADGLEHNPRGVPSSLAADHSAQLEKRLHKLVSFDYGSDWGEVRGEGDVCVLTWGSSSGAAFEAAERLAAAGVPTRVVALRLLAPLPREALGQALAGVRSIWVVEQNQRGQLFHYLRAEGVLPPGAHSHARPGPLPVRAGDIVKAVTGEA